MFCCRWVIFAQKITIVSIIVKTWVFLWGWLWFKLNLIHWCTVYTKLLSKLCSVTYYVVWYHGNINLCCRGFNRYLRGLLQIRADELIVHVILKSCIHIICGMLGSYCANLYALIVGLRVRDTLICHQWILSHARSGVKLFWNSNKFNHLQSVLVYIRCVK